MIHLRKRRLVILGVALLLVAGALFAVGDRFDVRARMDRVIAVVREAGPGPFFVAMALLPAVGFPLSAFTLIAGPMFAPTMGLGAVILCAMGAIACNVALLYWLSSRAMRPAAEWVMRRLGYRVPEMKPRAAWYAIVILRTVPVTPFCLQSILLGLARVPFGPYLLISIIVPSTYAIAMITLGDALMRGDPWAVAGAAGLFLIVGVSLHLMRKRLPAPSSAAPLTRADS